MGNIIRLTSDQVAEVSQTNESARLETTQRLKNKQKYFKAQMEDAQKRSIDLQALSEHSTLFNPEYYHDLHLLVDGLSALHDDPATPENEGFTMGIKQ